MKVQKTESYTITLSEQETVELAQTLYSDSDFNVRSVANDLFDELLGVYEGDQSLDITI